MYFQVMVIKRLRLNINVCDDDFDALLPTKYESISRKHWTSIRAAKLASDFLVEKFGTRVLDIGSGVGKFCLVGALTTKGFFTGVEQRKELVTVARSLAARYLVGNVHFIHDNITSIQFADFDAFYFYNSFYENIEWENRIDDSVSLHSKLYRRYSSYVAGQLASLRPGSRLVTNCGSTCIIPKSYKRVDSVYHGKLDFWEKITTDSDPVYS
jgi:SAM-dependent methyltransferase